MVAPIEQTYGCEGVWHRIATYCPEAYAFRAFHECTGIQRWMKTSLRHVDYEDVLWMACVTDNMAILPSLVRCSGGDSGIFVAAFTKDVTHGGQHLHDIILAVPRILRTSRLGQLKPEWVVGVERNKAAFELLLRWAHPTMHPVLGSILLENQELFLSCNKHSVAKAVLHKETPLHRGRCVVLEEEMLRFDRGWIVALFMLRHGLTHELMRHVSRGIVEHNLLHSIWSKAKADIHDEDALAVFLHELGSTCFHQISPHHHDILTRLLMVAAHKTTMTWTSIVHELFRNGTKVPSTKTEKRRRQRRSRRHEQEYDYEWRLGVGTVWRRRRAESDAEEVLPEVVHAWETLALDAIPEFPASRTFDTEGMFMWCITHPHTEEHHIAKFMAEPSGDILTPESIRQGIAGTHCGKVALMLYRAGKDIWVGAVPRMLWEEAEPIERGDMLTMLRDKGTVMDRLASHLTVFATYTRHFGETDASDLVLTPDILSSAVVMNLTRCKNVTEPSILCARQWCVDHAGNEATKWKLEIMLGALGGRLRRRRR